MPSFNDIPKFTSSGAYTVDIPLDFLHKWVSDTSALGGLDMDPEFQRGHVWTQEQQIKFVEYMFRGGKAQTTLFLNHPSYQGPRSARCDLPDTLVLVDGKQRLTAALRFMNDEFRIFGHFNSEYDDLAGRRRAFNNVNFKMAVNALQTNAEVLTWYIDLNDGGVVHSTEEIASVKALRDAALVRPVVSAPREEMRM